MHIRGLWYIIISLAFCSMSIPLHSIETIESKRMPAQPIQTAKQQINNLQEQLLPLLNQLTQTDAIVALIRLTSDIIQNELSDEKLLQYEAANKQDKDTSIVLKNLFKKMLVLYKNILENKYDESMSESIEYCIQKATALLKRKKRMDSILSSYKNVEFAYKKEGQGFEQSVSIRDAIDNIQDAIKDIQPFLLPIITELSRIQIPQGSYLSTIQNFYTNLQLQEDSSKKNFSSLNFEDASPLIQAIVTPTQEIGRRALNNQYKEVKQSREIKKLVGQVIDAIRNMANIRQEIVALQGPHRIRTNINKIDAPWYSYAWSAAKSIAKPPEYTLNELIAHKGITITPQLKAALHDYYTVIQDPAFEQKAESFNKVQDAVSIIKDALFPTKQKILPSLALQKESEEKLTATHQKYADLETQLIEKIKDKAPQDTIRPLQDQMDQLKQEETRLEKETTQNARLVSRGINTRNLESIKQKANSYKNKIESSFTATPPSASFKNQITEIQARIHELISEANPNKSREIFNKNYQDALNLLQTLDMYLEGLKTIHAIRALIKEVEDSDTFRPTVATLNSLLENQAQFDVSIPTRTLLSTLKEFSLNLTNLYNETLQKDPTKSFIEKLGSNVSTKAANIGSSVENTRTGVENIGAGIAAVQDAAATVSENIATAKRWYNSIASALAVLKSPNETIKKYVSNAAINMLQFFKNKVQQATTSLVYIP